MAPENAHRLPRSISSLTAWLDLVDLTSFIHDFYLNHSTSDSVDCTLKHHQTHLRCPGACAVSETETRQVHCSNGVRLAGIAGPVDNGKIMGVGGIKPGRANWEVGRRRWSVTASCKVHVKTSPIEMGHERFALGLGIHCFTVTFTPIHPSTLL